MENKSYNAATVIRITRLAERLRGTYNLGFGLDERSMNLVEKIMSESETAHLESLPPEDPLKPVYEEVRKYYTTIKKRNPNVMRTDELNTNGLA